MISVPSLSFGGQDCFSTHVEEAIELNEEREPIYFSMDARTKAVSQGLITMERLLLPFAHLLDKAARPYQKNGMGFMCDEFVDIAETPPQEIAIKPLESPVEEFAKPPNDRSLKRLRRAMNAGQFTAVYQISDAMVEELLKTSPHHYCLRRHFLESIRRIANLAPTQIAEARSNGLPSPRSLIVDLFKLHSIGLWQARRLDRLAIPLQNKGISILCNDVPEIPAS